MYEGESIKNQPNLFLVEIDLFFFDVIALYNDDLDRRCSSAISPELKKPGSLSLTHSSTATTSSSLDQ